MDECILIRPDATYIEEIRAYRAEFAACLDWMHGTGGLMKIEDPQKWLQYVAACASSDTTPAGQSSSSQFIYVRQTTRKIVGMINVRHYPVGPLETWGGHIGYSVCPSERRKGYATRMLHDVLPYCREIGLVRVLLTEGDENVGSIKTILANGGVFERAVLSPKHHVMVGRYWIEL